MDNDIIGYAAAFLTTTSFLPQAWQTLRTWDVSGLSFGMYAAFTSGVALWLAYGLATHNIPLVVANSLTFVLSASILAVKCRAGRRHGVDNASETDSGPTDVTRCGIELGKLRQSIDLLRSRSAMSNDEARTEASRIRRDCLELEPSDASSLYVELIDAFAQRVGAHHEMLKLLCDVDADIANWRWPALIKVAAPVFDEAMRLATGPLVPDNSARSVALDVAARMLPLQAAEQQPARYQAFLRALDGLPAALQVSPVTSLALHMRKIANMLGGDVFRLALRVGIEQVAVQPLAAIAARLWLLPPMDSPPDYADRSMLSGRGVVDCHTGLVVLQECLRLFNGSPERSKLLGGLVDAAMAFDDSAWSSGVLADVVLQLDTVDAQSRLPIVESLIDDLSVLCVREADMLREFCLLWDVCTGQGERMLARLKVKCFNALSPSLRDKALTWLELERNVSRTEFFDGPPPSDGQYWKSYFERGR